MKLFRNILKGSALTAALFVFQACYGTAFDEYDTCLFYKFKVIDIQDGNPIKDVAVSRRLPVQGNEPEYEWSLCGLTDNEGIEYANTYATSTNEWEFRFYAPDREYEIKDTIIKYTDDMPEIVIKLKKADRQ